MSETLLAILLVTHSAKGHNLVYHWPPHPVSHPRLARPRPDHDSTCHHADNPWRAAYSADTTQSCRHHAVNEDDYLWHRPHVGRERSLSLKRARSHPTSRRASPSKDLSDSLILDNNHEHPPPDEYNPLLGYSPDFLASILCPHKAMCHQKFELVVDDLAFLGHPVCCDADGVWRFRSEKSKAASRGRGSRKGRAQSPQAEDVPQTPEQTTKEIPTAPATSLLQTFHLVLVLDRPDPSSTATGNLARYLGILYEQIAFSMTAVLYQEQVIHNFVESECETLIALKDDYAAKGQLITQYLNEAMKVSSIATSIKTLYDAIKERSIARITIRDFSLELQLPPFLDHLLYNEDPLDSDWEDREGVDDDDFDNAAAWGSDMSFAWRLPALTPWKALLRMDDQGDRGYELYMKLRGPQLNQDDRDLAEQLIKFLETASVTLCLADMASLLDWDLEAQVYPIVRWLVQHRRAKIVDAVHPGLKTIFSLPQKFSAPISDLSAEFSRAFSHPVLPALPQLLSQISISTSTSAHFYGAVVRSRDLIPLYHDVVIWMLKRDLLVTLHLRVRIIATPELKAKARMRRELAHARRGRLRSQSVSTESNQEGESSNVSMGDYTSRGSDGPLDSSPVDYWMPMSPRAARAKSRRLSSAARMSLRDRSTSVHDQSGLPEEEDVEDEEYEGFDEDIDLASSSGLDDVMYPGRDGTGSSMIPDPGRANALERQWLSAMSEGKPPYIARRFEQINQYFDGKCSDDEILFKADISRKQLREVLHHYDGYLQTFLHPAS